MPIAPNHFDDTDFQWELDETIIAWDGGNGTSSAWHLVDDRLEYFMLPNVRVPVTGYGMNKDVTTIGTNEMVYADVMNFRVVAWGRSVARFRARTGWDGIDGLCKRLAHRRHQNSAVLVESFYVFAKVLALAPGEKQLPIAKSSPI